MLKSSMPYLFSFGLLFRTRIMPRAEAPRGGLLCLCFFLLLFAVPDANGRTPISEQQKIEALLDAVRTTDAVFIRNGKEHTSKEAYDHLRRKVDAAQSSLFGPRKENWTVQLFIDKVASRSSVSSRPYLLRLPDGTVLEAETWLTRKLRELEAPVEAVKDSADTVAPDASAP